MLEFNFEKNLEHQSQAVESTVSVFHGLEIIKDNSLEKHFVNPLIDRTKTIYGKNLSRAQTINEITDAKYDVSSNIIDIMMETGTGKTYTYTKTIFELNRLYGIFKFIIVVPTLSIKAGTINFLKSDSSREHFKEQYGKTINLHIVESKKGSKNKKSYFPPAVSSFVNAGDFQKEQIQVMIINSGMINSETMSKHFDKTLIDKYSVPFDAIAATKPFLVIDEPHKFAKTNKTWENIQKIKPQFILRYGATFSEKTIKIKNALGKKEDKIIKDYHNLVYTLNAVDSFNRNLVKGVIGHITEFKEGKNVLIRFISYNSKNKEVSFELIKNINKKSFKLIKGESLGKIDSCLNDFVIEKVNKDTVVFTNSIVLTKGDKINPYSYSETLQESMIKKAVENHFQIEKELLTREIKIKPLTLFFIDNINEYRGVKGYLKKTIQDSVKAHAKKLLSNERNTFYKRYLEKTLEDVSLTHGGYFSKDNSENDEAIEKEINEILHDKQAILDLENPRRFIFSKWTLREGWDNPNVFQICKLRSSGSEISKLQEVGRGLRLPVNEFGNRVKDEQFYLNYFVDFTENNFVEKLVKEINNKSGAISIEEIPEKLTEEMIKSIIKKYNIKDEDDFIDELCDKDIIKASHKFKEGGFEFIRNNYPLIFDGIDSNKIRKEKDNTKKIKVRTEKYSELKTLWEKLNEKVLLEYKINTENEFKNLFIKFLKEQEKEFNTEKIFEKKLEVGIESNSAYVKEEYSLEDNEYSIISTMKYSNFLEQLSNSLNINMKTIHSSFIESKIDINKYLNAVTIRTMKAKFKIFLMYNAIDKFGIEYQKVTNMIHPNKLTDEKGNVYHEINSSDVGISSSTDSVSHKYLFEELYFDSPLEKENIITDIEEVIVFTKIPKSSIKIPVAGGLSYSPDFAYVIKNKNGNKKLFFIVETKDTDEESLRKEEIQKIKHAEIFFNNEIEIKFKTQFKTNKMVDLMREIYG